MRDIEYGDFHEDSLDRVRRPAIAEDDNEKKPAEPESLTQTDVLLDLRDPLSLPVMISCEISCSWCHHMNQAGEEFCANCGHCAGKPRLQCYCLECRGRTLEHLLEHSDQPIVRE
jgi:hypothetical protein